MPDSKLLRRVKAWARRVESDVQAIGLAARDPRTPWYAKALAMTIVAYALSPIDLIPDFVPILGYLDDALIVPLGILLVVRLIPEDVLAEHRAVAAATTGRPVSSAGAVLVILVWTTAIIAASLWLWPDISD